MKISAILLFIGCLSSTPHVIAMAKSREIGPLKDHALTTKYVFDEKPKRHPKLFRTLQRFSTEPELQYALAIRYEHNPSGVSPEAWSRALGSLYASNGEDLVITEVGLTFTELQNIILALSPAITDKILTLDITKNAVTDLPLAVMHLPNLKMVLLDPTVTIPIQLKHHLHVFRQIA